MSDTTQHSDAGTAQGWSRRTTTMAWAIVLLGIALRLAMYASDRGLWLDEAMQATSIVNRTIPELMQPPLEFNQVGTPVFLAAERLAVEAFGPSEMALRLVPLIAGCLSLVFFLLAVRLCVSPGAALIALALFALSEPMVYYASEVKSYSCGMLATCIILWAAMRIHVRAFATREIIIFSVITTLLVWLQVSVIFIAAAMFAVLVSMAWLGGHRKAAVVACVGGAVTAGSFLVMYKLFIAPTTSAYFDSAMAHYYVALGGYMPMPPKSLQDLEWFFTTPFEFFIDPMGLPTFGLMALSACIGLAIFWKQNRFMLLVLVAPFALALVASAIRQYPFITRGHYDTLLMGRNILFLAPLAFVLIGGGLHRLAESLRPTARQLPALAVLIALAYPAFYTAKQIKDPSRGAQDIRPALKQIKDQWQEGDAVYLGWSANIMFEYYGQRFGLERSILLNNDASTVRKQPPGTLADPAIVPSFLSSPEVWVRMSDWKTMEQILLPKIEARKPKRIWVLFAYHSDSFGYAEAKFITHQLAKRGKCEKVISTTGVGLFLCELGETN